MQNLSDFVKNFFKKSGLISLIIFQIFSTIVFFAIYYNVKQKHLTSTLNISSGIISKSFEVGDWDLILSHLNSLNLFSKIEDLEVFLPTGELIIGPIGFKKNGINFICKKEVGNLFTLQGCSSVIGASEIPVFLVVQILILISYSLVFLIFLKKIKEFSEILSTSLNKLNDFDDIETIFSGNPITEVQEINSLKNKMVELLKKEKDSAEIEFKQNLVRRIAHDIRSPLAALKVVKEMGASGMEPDVAKLLTMSIDRITDIANTILPKNTVQIENEESAQSSFLWMLVDQIISEKRVEYKSSSNISIDFKTESSPFELNVLCNPTEFMRSISNIINNSIEAKDPLKKLNISVSLSRSQDFVLLTIQDNGKGMPPEVLAKAFNEGFTHGKAQGTGLGLYQVKKAIESWGGSIHIESQTNVGTIIIIKLKQSAQPQWLVNSIDVSKCKNIVVLDDEEYVFSILQDRFESYVKLQYFKRIDDFEKNIPTFSDTLFFIDHDLKQDVSGIDLIQKHSLQNLSILLTGNYDDKQVQQKASAIGIKILPKPLINDLPIIV